MKRLAKVVLRIVAGGAGAPLWLAGVMAVGLFLVGCLMVTVGWMFVQYAWHGRRVPDWEGYRRPRAGRQVIAYWYDNGTVVTVGGRTSYQVRCDDGRIVVDGSPLGPLVCDRDDRTGGGDCDGQGLTAAGGAKDGHGGSL